MGDHLEVADYLHPLESKSDIRNLGLALGLHYDRLKAIEKTSDSYLDDVISAWLRREGDVDKKGGPRWSALVKALRHWRLRQIKIANDIEKNLRVLYEQDYSRGQSSAQGICHIHALLA